MDARHLAEPPVRTVDDRAREVTSDAARRQTLMSRTLLFVAVLLTFPAIAKQYTIEQFKEVVQLSGLSFSHDGKRILFSSNATGIYNVYSVAVSGGKPAQLTHSTTRAMYAVSSFPHDDRVLVMHDREGDENDHLYVEERDLTPGGNSEASFKGWNAGGTAFFYSGNARDPKVNDVYRVDLADFARTMIFKNDGAFSVNTVSPDGRWIALTKSSEPNDQDIYLHDTKSGMTKLITQHSGAVMNRPQTFDASSRFLYFLSDEGTEYQHLRRVDVEPAHVDVIDRADGDVAFVRLSRDGALRVEEIDRDGSGEMHVTDQRSGRALPLPLAGLNISSAVIAPAGNAIAFYAERDSSPSNLYLFDLKSRLVKKLTNTLTASIDPADLVDGTMIRFRSFDGLSIPALLYKPKEIATKAPAVVWVHGGPGGQMAHGYFSLIQYFVNHGYVFLGVNNRGSGGFGKAFKALDVRRHGREPLRDCIEAKRYLATLPYVDASRIAIAGESYGGYMTLAALTFYPDEFAAGVDFYGPSNWIRTLEAIPPSWESYRKSLEAEMGDPVKDRVMLEEISPFFHPERITKPLMIEQGGHDPRVAKGDTDGFVETLRKHGVAVDYVVYPDEGHGLTKRKNQIDAFRAALQFLDRALRR
jgi:dipeptidyl aminopeptidase/acylaminoacyl peptidase